MSKEQEKVFCRIAYVIIVLITLIPILAQYVMDNDSIISTIEYVENLVKQPDPCGWKIWFWIPVILRRIGFTITVSYQICMFLMQIISFVGIWWFGRHIFENDKQIVFLVAFYLLNPIYLSFSYAEMCPDGLVLWGLIPFICGTVLELFEKIRGNKQNKSIWNIVVFIAFLVFLLFVFVNVINNLQVSTDQCTRGYHLGKMISSFAHEEGYPGLGVGILTAVALFLWQRIAWNRKIEKKFWVYGAVAVTFMILSSSLFMWRNPSLLLGCSVLPLSVLGTLGVTGFREEDGIFIQIGVPIMVFLSVIGVSLYLCNDWMYTYLPLFLKDILIQ